MDCTHLRDLENMARTKLEVKIMDKNKERLNTARSFTEILYFMNSFPFLQDNFIKNYNEWSQKISDDYEAFEISKSTVLETLKMSKFLRIITTTLLSLCILETCRCTNERFLVLGFGFYLVLLLLNTISFVIITFCSSLGKHIEHVLKYFETSNVLISKFTQRLITVAIKYKRNFDPPTLLKNKRIIHRKSDFNFYPSVFSFYNIYGISLAVFIFGLCFHLHLDSFAFLESMVFYLIISIAIVKDIKMIVFIKELSSQRKQMKIVTKNFKCWFESESELNRVAIESEIRDTIINLYLSKHFKMPEDERHLSFAIISVMCLTIVRYFLDGDNLEDVIYFLFYGISKKVSVEEELNCTVTNNISSIKLLYDPHFNDDDHSTNRNVKDNIIGIKGERSRIPVLKTVKRSSCINESLLSFNPSDEECPKKLESILMLDKSFQPELDIKSKENQYEDLEISAVSEEKQLCAKPACEELHMDNDINIRTYLEDQLEKVRTQISYNAKENDENEIETSISMYSPESDIHNRAVSFSSVDTDAQKCTSSKIEIELDTHNDERTKKVIKESELKKHSCEMPEKLDTELLKNNSLTCNNEEKFSDSLQKSKYFATEENNCENQRKDFKQRNVNENDSLPLKNNVEKSVCSSNPTKSNLKPKEFNEASEDISDKNPVPYVADGDMEATSNVIDEEVNYDKKISFENYQRSVKLEELNCRNEKSTEIRENIDSRSEADIKKEMLGSNKAYTRKEEKMVSEASEDISDKNPVQYVADGDLETTSNVIDDEVNYDKKISFENYQRNAKVKELNCRNEKNTDVRENLDSISEADIKKEMLDSNKAYTRKEEKMNCRNEACTNVNILDTSNETDAKNEIKIDSRSEANTKKEMMDSNKADTRKERKMDCRNKAYNNVKILDPGNEADGKNENEIDSINKADAEVNEEFISNEVDTKKEEKLDSGNEAYTNIENLDSGNETDTKDGNKMDSRNETDAEIQENRNCESENISDKYILPNLTIEDLKCILTIITNDLNYKNNNSENIFVSSQRNSRIQEKLNSGNGENTKEQAMLDSRNEANIKMKEKPDSNGLDTKIENLDSNKKPDTKKLETLDPQNVPNSRELYKHNLINLQPDYSIKKGNHVSSNSNSPTEAPIFTSLDRNNEIPLNNNTRLEFNTQESSSNNSLDLKQVEGSSQNKIIVNSEIASDTPFKEHYTGTQNDTGSSNNSGVAGSHPEINSTLHFTGNNASKLKVCEKETETSEKYRFTNKNVLQNHMTSYYSKKEKKDASTINFNLSLDVKKLPWNTAFKHVEEYSFPNNEQNPTFSDTIERTKNYAENNSLLPQNESLHKKIVDDTKTQTDTTFRDKEVDTMMSSCKNINQEFHSDSVEQDILNNVPNTENSHLSETSMMQLKNQVDLKHETSVIAENATEKQSNAITFSQPRPTKIGKRHLSQKNSMKNERVNPVIQGEKLQDAAAIVESRETLNYSLAKIGTFQSVNETKTISADQCSRHIESDDSLRLSHQNIPNQKYSGSKEDKSLLSNNKNTINMKIPAKLSPRRRKKLDSEDEKETAQHEKTIYRVSSLQYQFKSKQTMLFENNKNVTNDHSASVRPNAREHTSSKYSQLKDNEKFSVDEKENAQKNIDLYNKTEIANQLFRSAIDRFENANSSRKFENALPSHLNEMQQKSNSREIQKKIEISTDEAEHGLNDYSSISSEEVSKMTEEFSDDELDVGTSEDENFHFHSSTSPSMSNSQITIVTTESTSSSWTESKNDSVEQSCNLAATIKHKSLDISNLGISDDSQKQQIQYCFPSQQTRRCQSLENVFPGNTSEAQNFLYSTSIKDPFNKSFGNNQTNKAIWRSSLFMADNKTDCEQNASQETVESNYGTHEPITDCKDYNHSNTITWNSGLRMSENTNEFELNMDQSALNCSTKLEESPSQEHTPVKYKLRYENLNLDLLDSSSCVTLRLESDKESGNTKWLKNTKMRPSTLNDYGNEFVVSGDSVSSCSGWSDTSVHVEERNLAMSADYVSVDEASNLTKSNDKCVSSVGSDDSTCHTANEPRKDESSFRINNGSLHLSQASGKENFQLDKMQISEKEQLPEAGESSLQMHDDDAANMNLEEQLTECDGTLINVENPDEDFLFETDSLKLNYKPDLKSDSIQVSYRRFQNGTKLIFKSKEKKLYLKMIPRP